MSERKCENCIHFEVCMYVHPYLPVCDSYAESVKHGRWIEQEAPNMDTYYDCSACGESFVFTDGSPADNLYTYCPNCGAKMDGGDAECP